MDRTAIASRVVSVNMHPGWASKALTGSDARFPGGFAPIPTTEEGEVFYLWPERLVAVGAHLDDDDFKKFCQAVAAFQSDTAIGFGLHQEAEFVLLAFTERCPDEAALLARMAEHEGLSLAEFVGAQHALEAPQR